MVRFHAVLRAMDVELQLRVKQVAQSVNATNQPCLSCCHPQPLAVVLRNTERFLNDGHGSSSARQSSLSEIASGFSTTFSGRRGLRQLFDAGALVQRVCMSALRGNWRALSFCQPARSPSLSRVPPRHRNDDGDSDGALAYSI